MRVDIPRPIWLLVQAMAVELNQPKRPELGLTLLIRRISALVEVGHVGLLGDEWAALVKQIKKDNFGYISDGEPIDTAKLHRSARAKSGYVGVYPTGKGYRADARIKNGGGIKTLGTFDTTDEAAWRRYLYYRDNNMPYGELEVDVDAWRARGEVGDDETLARMILADADEIGTRHIYDANIAGLKVQPKMLGFDTGMEEILAKHAKEK